MRSETLASLGTPGNFRKLCSLASLGVLSNQVSKVGIWLKALQVYRKVCVFTREWRSHAVVTCILSAYVLPTKIDLAQISTVIYGTV